MKFAYCFLLLILSFTTYSQFNLKSYYPKSSHVTNIFEFKYDDFQLVGYDPHPSIKAEISV